MVGDLLDGLPEVPDAVLANLPYVPDGVALMDDVAVYEPAWRCAPAPTAWI